MTAQSMLWKQFFLPAGGSALNFHENHKNHKNREKNQNTDGRIPIQIVGNRKGLEGGNWHLMVRKSNSFS